MDRTAVITSGEMFALSSPEFAWLVVLCAMFSAGANARSYLRKLAPKNAWIRFLTTAFSLYIGVIYIFIGLGILPVGNLAAALARIALVGVLLLLAINALRD